MEAVFNEIAVIQNEIIAAKKAYEAAQKTLMGKVNALLEQNAPNLGDCFIDERGDKLLIFTGYRCDKISDVSELIPMAHFIFAEPMVYRHIKSNDRAYESDRNPYSGDKTIIGNVQRYLQLKKMDPALSEFAKSVIDLGLQRNHQSVVFSVWNSMMQYTPNREFKITQERAAIVCLEFAICEKRFKMRINNKYQMAVWEGNDAAPFFDDKVHKFFTEENIKRINQCAV